MSLFTFLCFSYISCNVLDP
jgi:hypothetical protein